MYSTCEQTSDASFWEGVRGQFDLSNNYVHIGASQFVASHPRQVNEAIARYRRELDRNPVAAVEEHEDNCMQAVSEEACEYCGTTDPDMIALPDSTTMGLGLIYQGISLPPDAEILLTNHEYYPHEQSIQFCANRNKAEVRKFSLYEVPAEASVEQMVSRTEENIRDNTRIVAMTWVHSGTGVKVPLKEIGELIADINQGRGPDQKIRFCIDGVQGFGVETESVAELRCHFFATGTHTWIYGPRGTGLVWGTPEAWQNFSPSIPSFTEIRDAWMGEREWPGIMNGKYATPGGSHSFEHRWAAAEAFRFHKKIGRHKIRERVRSLNLRCKTQLNQLRHVRVHTPLSDSVSSGIICFEVTGFAPKDLKRKLFEEKYVVATIAPYKEQYLRFTPGIINSEDDVDRAVTAVAELMYVNRHGS